MKENMNHTSDHMTDHTTSCSWNKNSHLQRLSNILEKKWYRTL